MTLPAAPASAQRQKKTDKLLLTNLDRHIHFLSDEKREGRRTGTPGEKVAGDYIASAFSNAGLQPKGDKNGWLQAFDIDQGRVVSGDAFLIINDHPLLLNKEYFPMAFSAVGTVSGSPAMALQESGVPWFFDLRDLLESDAGGVRVDLYRAIRERASAFAKKGATALLVYNSSKTPDNLAFDANDRSEPAAIPILYITAAAKRKYLRDESASVDIRIRTGFSEKKFTGHNVVGYIDNGAASTVVIGAQYDWSAAADSAGSPDTAGADNAGGVAAMIELARLLAVSKLKNNNYLFVAFSGGEQGSAGSAFMAAHLPVDPQRLNYMLDLDRLYPVHAATRRLVIGGYGSSPAWWGACREVRDKPGFPVQLDSSYSRPGDQATFYSRGIPALVFYVGPDKTDRNLELATVKYVFDIVKAVDNRGRLAFARSAAGS